MLRGSEWQQRFRPFTRQQEKSEQRRIAATECERNCVTYIRGCSHVRREWNGCPISSGDSGASAFSDESNK